MTIASLTAIPIEIIELVFSFVPPDAAVRFFGLCRRVRAILQTSHFARLCLRRAMIRTSAVSSGITKEPDSLDRMWFLWPKLFQDAFATLRHSDSTEVRWRNKSLYGSIPISISSSTKLTYLSLSGNTLSGSIPVELGGLTTLTTLYLSGNSFTGCIPTSFGNLVHLKYLSLRQNRLTGNVPKEFGSLTCLKELYLDCNNLSGAIPSELGKLKYLEVLYVLGGNQFEQVLEGVVDNVTPAGYLLQKQGFLNFHSNEGVDSYCMMVKI
ncbi:hypothetical protein BDR26DRAFT_151026 [Obelidium mucronatum]|nr:hypothetical protein BDR26DRAFT_151026 [Obelidium mucronatum]